VLVYDSVTLADEGDGLEIMIRDLIVLALQYCHDGSGLLVGNGVNWVIWNCLRNKKNKYCVQQFHFVLHVVPDNQLECKLDSNLIAYTIFDT